MKWYGWKKWRASSLDSQGKEEAIPIQTFLAKQMHLSPTDLPFYFKMNGFET